MKSEALAGTAPLIEAGDFAERMVAGIGKFLDRQLEAADREAAGRLARAVESPEAQARAVAAKRARLARIVGAVDERVPATLELVATVEVPARVASTPGYDVYAVRWPALPGVDGEGLLLQPRGEAVANVVALPDANWTPEQLAGLVRSIPEEAQFARRLAQMGCRVVVPALVDRNDTWSGNPRIKVTNQPHREYVYRMAFQMGRHVIGYEVQKVLALVDGFSAERRRTKDEGRRVPWQADDSSFVFRPWSFSSLPAGVFGYGEGGLLALVTGALDARIAVTGVSGYFRNRTRVWREPIYRNVWGLLRGFGDAELAAMIAPRTLVVEACDGPVVDGPPPAREGRQGAAPGALGPVPRDEVRAEVERVRPVFAALGAGERLALVETEEVTGAARYPGGEAALGAFLDALRSHGAAGTSIGMASQSTGATSLTGQAAPVIARRGPLATLGVTGERRAGERDTPADAGSAGGARGAGGVAGSIGAVLAHDPETRQRRQFEQLCEYTQGLVRLSYRARDAFWREADVSSLEAWRRSTQRYREYLWDEVMGRLPAPPAPPNPRTRRVYDEPAWTGYEVRLDVWIDVFAYGVLLLPKDLAPGERRPVVVCQHGLEGRPVDVIEKEGRPYEQFARRLVERGYVVYAPQNPYIGRETFRMLQRKANPLGWSLFSFIVAQHRVTLAWLSAQAFVDPARIAFYGLSYGGKTAMRVPALLDGPGEYCLSICSGDFNEWIVKCASTELQMSYMFTAEWEMFEFDLGHTFNYAEMAYLIAPRPFMVERGHRDGVAFDEWVAFEYAKVRRRYADLKLPERTEIAYFDGPHTIDGSATYPFLDKHLGWTPSAGRDAGSRRLAGGRRRL